MSAFDKYLDNKIEASFGAFVEKLNQVNQNATNNLFNATVTGTDSTDPSGTTFSTTLANGQVNTVYAGKRVIRPGDVVTNVGLRAF